MIESLQVLNYKSLKDIKIPCKKINVFIGDPNGGKSNIIEALSLMSQGVITNELSKEIVRYKTLGDLFFDFNINKPIEIQTNEMSCKFKYAIRENGIPENNFELELRDHVSQQKSSTITIRHDGKIQSPGAPISTKLRIYQYKRLDNFQITYMPHLAPPFGENLPSLLVANEDYRNWVNEFFENKGFTLTMKPVENEINMSKIVNRSIYSYPYQTISETLQRVVFYIMSMKSNNNSILLYDEPETNTFPFYTKFLAERIALDETNQFFITTHNPYLLLNLIEKSTTDNLNVCLVKMNEYQTKVTPLNKDQIAEVLELNSDVFFNLDRIVE